MSWFKKEKKCPLNCPVLENILESEAVRCGFRVEPGIIPYPKPPTNGLPWRVEILEDKEKSLSRDLSELKCDVDNARALIQHEIMLGRPSKFNSLLMRLEVIEDREKELRFLVCKQKSRSDELEKRIAELEKKSRELNINIITKTEEAKVELQKGE